MIARDNSWRGDIQIALKSLKGPKIDPDALQDVALSTDVGGITNKGNNSPLN